MTEEELAAIRQRATLGWQTPETRPPLPKIVAGAVRDVAALLREVGLQRAENADLLGVCESLVTNPSAARILEDYRLAIAAIRAENTAMRHVMARSYADVIKHGKQGRCDCWTCSGIYELMTEAEARKLLAKDGDA